MSGSAVTLERRLANLRARVAASGDVPGIAERGAAGRARAERLAEGLGAEIVATPRGCLVVRRSPASAIPVDREALARLPGGPPPDAPLLCLDTETTGLATAAGTVAFLVGLGWWRGDAFHQAQLLLPDFPDEAVLLDEIEARLGRDGWLVTYNGRGFDWPLLTARYRLALRPPPPLGGHVDLLPLVRRILRHRLPDARLKSVEAGVLGFRRVGDVGGWEIPGRYFEVVRGGPPELLYDVVRHNDQDVRSLARLLAHLAAGVGSPAAWSRVHRGDLAGLGRAYRLTGQLTEALACIQAALAAPEPARVASPASGAASLASGRRAIPGDRRGPIDVAALDGTWTEVRLLVEQAHLLRRLGRYVEAAESWLAVAAGPGRIGLLAWIEVAKLREHRLLDLPGAREAAGRAWATMDRRRRLGFVEPRLEIAIADRIRRLDRRLAG